MVKRDNVYGRRKGRALRPAQSERLTRLLPDLSLSISQPAPEHLETLFTPAVRSVALEIGFGGGEHMTALARSDSSCGVIGAEPFLNGLAKAVSEIEESGLKNVRLYGKDAVPLLSWCPAGSLSDVYLLYPDPWPKRRHRKRRFVSQQTIEGIARALRRGGLFRFATDIDDYADWTLQQVHRHGALKWTAETSEDWTCPWPNWPGTRFEARAIKDGRKPTYLTFVKP